MKSVELCQTVACAINHITWDIPRIRDGRVWRNIENAHLVENSEHLNGHDLFEEAIFRAEKIMEELGWKTEISHLVEQFHEHLHYQHYRLKCMK